MGTDVMSVAPQAISVLLMLKYKVHKRIGTLCMTQLLLWCVLPGRLISIFCKCTPLSSSLSVEIFSSLLWIEPFVSQWVLSTVSKWLQDGCWQILDRTTDARPYVSWSAQGCLTIAAGWCNIHVILSTWNQTTGKGDFTENKTGAT